MTDVLAYRKVFESNFIFSKFKYKVIQTITCTIRDNGKSTSNTIKLYAFIPKESKYVEIKAPLGELRTEMLDSLNAIKAENIVCY